MRAYRYLPLMLLLACDLEAPTDGAASAAPRPGARAAAPDAGLPDAGFPDAGAGDAGRRDAGLRDAGSRDAGSRDAGARDAGPDAGLLGQGAAGDERRPVAGRDEAQQEGASDLLVLRGAVKQGGLVRAMAPPGTTKASFLGHRVRIAPDGKFLIAFAHDASKRQTLKLFPPGQAPIEHVFEVEQRSFATEEIDDLSEEEISPKDPDERRRLAAARKRIAAARETFSTIPFYESGFGWPAQGPVTSTYGVERVYDGKKRGRHWGVDIAVPTGTPVRAPADGVVIFAEADVPLSGSLIIIDHGHGLSSALLHLSDIAVTEGDQVKKGDRIGASGSSGRTTGPHLDWRMNLFQVPIDPMLVIGNER